VVGISLHLDSRSIIRIIQGTHREKDGEGNTQRKGWGREGENSRIRTGYGRGRKGNGGEKRGRG